MKVLTFFLEDFDIPPFIEWLKASQERIKTKDVGMIFKSLNYYRNGKLIVLSLDFILPNILPSFFFKLVLKKALKNFGVIVQYVNYEEALIYLTG